MHSTDLTLRDHASRQLRGLCGVVGLDAEAPVELLMELLADIGEHSTSDGPTWPSDIADDATPVEYSVAFDRNGEHIVRLLGETVGKNASPKANLHAAESLLERLAHRYDVPLDRFHAVSDLFLPENPQGKFAMWYSFIFRPNFDPEFKIYFNPMVQGQEHSNKLISEALDRLNLSSAFDITNEHAIRRHDHDQFMFFALDLDNSPSSRVKLYIAHHSATSESAEYAAQAVDGADPEQVRDFCSLVGGTTGIFDNRPLISSYSFTEGKSTPSNYSLYLPLRSYVPDDVTARERTRVLLRQHDVDPDIVDRTLAALTDRDLARGVGLIPHVSLRLGSTRPGTTVYLSSEAYAVMPPTVAA